MEYPFPEIMVDLIVKTYFDYDLPASNYPATISVTSLIDTPYIAQMRKYHEKDLIEKLEKDQGFRIAFAKKNWWLILGKAVHGIMEKLSGAEYATEQRREIHFNGTWLSGMYDVFEYETGTLMDYKVTSKYILKNDVRLRDYFWQLNLLRYISQHLEDYSSTGSTNYEVKKLKLILFLRDLIPSDKYSQEMPTNAIVEIDAPIYSDELVEKYIRERMSAHKIQMDLNFEENHCSQEERWYSPEKWAVMKQGAKKATKLLDNLHDATEYANKCNINKRGDIYEIDHRPETNQRCENYCDYNIFCNFYKSRYGDKNDKS